MSINYQEIINNLNEIVISNYLVKKDLIEKIEKFMESQKPDDFIVLLESIIKLLNDNDYKKYLSNIRENIIKINDEEKGVLISHLTDLKNFISEKKNIDYRSSYFIVNN
jgi:cobalamin biosynthesis Co2+ chelatase CbiK